MTPTDASTTHEPPPRSRVRAGFDRVPTAAYLLVAAVLIVVVIAALGGLGSSEKRYATATQGEAIDVGIAEVTIDRVRLHPTDTWGDPAEGAEFLTIRMTVTNTSASTYPVQELMTAGSLAAPLYGVNAISIDEAGEFGSPSLRTPGGEFTSMLGPRLTQTYDVTFELVEPLADRTQLTLVFAPNQYTPNKFLRDTSDGYYETLPTIAVGEFAITDEVSGP